MFFGINRYYQCKSESIEEEARALFYKGKL